MYKKYGFLEAYALHISSTSLGFYTEPSHENVQPFDCLDVVITSTRNKLIKTQEKAEETANTPFGQVDMCCLADVNGVPLFSKVSNCCDGSFLRKALSSLKPHFDLKYLVCAKCTKEVFDIVDGRTHIIAKVDHLPSMLEQVAKPAQMQDFFLFSFFFFLFSFFFFLFSFFFFFVFFVCF